MLVIKGRQLFENGKLLVTKDYTSQQAVSPSAHRAHDLARVAFAFGVDAAQRCLDGHDRTNLPEAAVIHWREYCGCGEMTATQTAEHLETLKLLSGKEWRAFNAKDDPAAFWTFQTMWQAGYVLTAVQAERPQYWFRLP